MSWYFSVICLGGEETKQFHDFENALASFVNSRCFRTNLKIGVSLLDAVRNLLKRH